VPVEAPAPAAAEPPAPVVTPVVAQAPSSSVVREVVAEVESAVLSVEDAVRNLVALVKDHRRAGDVDVENALTDVQAALAAKQ
jgi:hypothetical protein